jgi:hypothetical protein
MTIDIWIAIAPLSDLGRLQQKNCVLAVLVQANPARHCQATTTVHLNGLMFWAWSVMPVPALFQIV